VPYQAAFAQCASARSHKLTSRSSKAPACGTSLSAIRAIRTPTDRPASALHDLAVRDRDSRRPGTTAAADRGPIESDPENGGDLRKGGTATAEREAGVPADSHGQSVGPREPGRQGIFRFRDEHSHGPWGLGPLLLASMIQEPGAGSVSSPSIWIRWSPYHLRYDPARYQEGIVR
jgi:hypothetical protein